MSCLFCPLQEEEVGNTIDSETRRKHFYQIEKSLVVSAILKLSFATQALTQAAFGKF